MVASLSLNGIDATRVRLVTPWSGAWIADVDLAPPLPLPDLPGGVPAVINIGLNVLRGTIDSSATGIFGQRASCRVVGGSGGWSKTVAPLPFHNDAGLLSPVVIEATAAEVLETAVVAIPQVLGFDYIRSAGPASRVLDGLDWHVDLLGITQVAPRIPLPANPLTTEVLNFEPTAQRATVATDDVLSPATLLTDSRFGLLQVRDVEQIWDANGSRANAFCGPSTVPRLAGALRTFVKEAAGVVYLKTYRYRVISSDPDNRLILQPVDLTLGLPPTLPIAAWPGVPGVTMIPTPATEVLVAFVNGDPAQPVPVAFASGDDAAPTLLRFNAFAPIAFGFGVPPLAQPVAKMTALTSWAVGVEAALLAAGHANAPLFASVAADMASTKVITD
jgi:hypothetical protein